jgi:hypothetical protein
MVLKNLNVTVTPGYAVSSINAMAEEAAESI